MSNFLSMLYIIKKLFKWPSNGVRPADFDLNKAPLHPVISKEVWKEIHYGAIFPCLSHEGINRRATSLLEETYSSNKDEKEIISEIADRISSTIMSGIHIPFIIGILNLQTNFDDYVDLYRQYDAWRDSGEPGNNPIKDLFHPSYFLLANSEEFDHTFENVFDSIITDLKPIISNNWIDAAPENVFTGRLANSEIGNDVSNFVRDTIAFPVSKLIETVKQRERWAIEETEQKKIDIEKCRKEIEKHKEELLSEFSRVMRRGKYQSLDRRKGMAVVIEFMDLVELTDRCMDREECAEYIFSDLIEIIFEKETEIIPLSNGYADAASFEQWCALQATEAGFQSRLTPGSGDQGIDVLAYQTGLSVGIQCKHYSRPCGNSAVQEAFSGRSYYNLDAAIVVANCGFTRSAENLAASCNVILCVPDDLKSVLARLLRNSFSKASSSSPRDTRDPARVKPGSIVRVSENGSEAVYEISETLSDPSNGVIRKDSPLAFALLDLQEGDPFELTLGSRLRSGTIVEIS